MDEDFSLVDKSMGSLSIKKKSSNIQMSISSMNIPRPPPGSLISQSKTDILKQQL